MSEPSTTKAKRDPRRVLHLTASERLADELGSFGISVVPREAPIPGHERQAQREDFSLRRLIVAWRLLNRLEFPATIVAAAEGSPDFIVEKGVPLARIAVEVTTATNNDYQRQLTRTAQSPSPDRVEMGPEDGYVGSAVIRQLIDEIWSAIQQKLEKPYGWSDVDRRHLLIYVDSDPPIFPTDIESIVHGVRGRRGVSERGAVGFDEVHVIIREIVVVDAFGSADRVDVSAAYEIDLDKWTRAQTDALRSIDMTGIDRTNIAEELESMGRRDQRALRSQLRRVLLHLLKWRVQPSMRSASWRASIRESRNAIADILEDSPSLGGWLERFARDEFERARTGAIEETGMPGKHFPASNPFTVVR